MISDEKSIRIIVKSGRSDHELRNAIHASGRKSFAQATARAFAGMAALGETGVAAEIVRVWSSRARKTWCNDDTLVAARSVFGRDHVVTVRCPGREAVVLSGSIMSSPHEEAMAELAVMIRMGDTAGALEHSCALLEHGCGDTAWGAVGVCCTPRGDGGRASAYVDRLRGVYEACGTAVASGSARRMLMDAAVAVAAGELSVKRPALHESDKVMRRAALYSVQRAKPPSPGRKKRSVSGGETKTLQLASESRISCSRDVNPRVRVLKQ
jgi:cellobiose-specific phosphotransferase system component IIA